MNRNQMKTWRAWAHYAMEALDGATEIAGEGALNRYPGKGHVDVCWRPIATELQHKNYYEFIKLTTLERVNAQAEVLGEDAVKAWLAVKLEPDPTYRQIQVFLDNLDETRLAMVNFQKFDDSPLALETEMLNFWEKCPNGSKIRFWMASKEAPINFDQFVYWIKQYQMHHETGGHPRAHFGKEKIKNK